jgi:hypothetical protein
MVSFVYIAYKEPHGNRAALQGVLAPQIILIQFIEGAFTKLFLSLVQLLPLHTTFT